MHISRIDLARDTPALKSLAALIADGVGPADAHRLLWALFAESETQTRDFHYRREGPRGQPRFYVVSERPPVDRNGLFRIDTKPYAPHLTVGRRLRFVLRANPTVTRPRGEGRSSARHDVIMDALKRRKATDTKAFVDRVELVRQEAVRWLASRAEAKGFTLVEGGVAVDGYTQHRLPRRGGGKPAQLSSVDFEGLLTVADPERFVTTLHTGIGHGKAFGMGLLLVRPE